MTVFGLHVRRLPTLAAFLLALVAAPAVAQRPAAAAPEAAPDLSARLEADAHYIQPPAPIADFFKRDPNFAVLNTPSPDGRYFIVPSATQLSNLDLMSRPTYRLAEVEIRPATDRLWHLDTYGINQLRFYDMKERTFRDVTLPANSFASDIVWSPDGARIAFLAHLPKGSEVWTADAATGRARRFSSARVMATIGTSAAVDISPEISMRPSRMLQWTPEGTLLTLIVPTGRGAEPARSAVPNGPKLRITRPKAVPSRTLPNLLENNHDSDLFEFYTRSQLVELTEGGAPRALGAPQMYESIALSSDGKHVMASYYERPFSFITSYRSFPGRTVIVDRSGTLVSTIDVRPLREGGGGFRPGGGGSGMRSVAWRPDVGGLSFLRRAGAAGDQVMLLAAPFDTTAATVVATSPDPIRSITYSRDGRRAFATVTKGGQTGVVQWELGQPTPERKQIVRFAHPDSLFTAPGDLWTERTPNGIEYALVSSANDAVYLLGDGLRPDFKPQPFVDRISLADTSRTRLFEGASTTWDRPLVALDPDLRQMIVRREGKELFPDSYLWTPNAALVNLTHNRDPFPELAAAKRIDFSFKRQDGLEVQGRISLPLSYREGQKVPAVFWTYPREFTTTDGYTRAALRARNQNEFTNMTWLRWSELWLTQGYALVYPDIPIIGENYNDTYISNMVDAMYGAMRAVDKLNVVDMDRIGHGGHSYGAFATANLLAHTPFFRAGIAGDGAYNRSLTPFGFQAEPRTIWAAPDTYLEMSPFFKVDQINAPMLMYHGADDNNSGTWPVQSERMIEALTSMGKNSALYVYPYESHTPRAIENTLDLWARWIDWFDRYVKTTDSPMTVGGSSR